MFIHFGEVYVKKDHIQLLKKEPGYVKQRYYAVVVALSSNSNNIREILRTDLYSVIEVDITGVIVWQCMANSPMDAERLSNGNTMITEYGRVFEVDPAGSIVWQITGLNHALDAEGFFTEPPRTPSIDGSNKGKTGVSYPFTFVTNDPEGEIVFYYIDWGDDINTGWIGPYPSGEEVIINHSWSKKGDYLIRCKAKDVIYAESDWETFEVSIPRNRVSDNSLFFRFLERFPLLQKILIF
jgi:hypothetical protein